MKGKKLFIFALLLLISVIMLFTACSENLVVIEFFVDGVSYKTYKVKSGDDFDDIPDVPEKEGYKGVWDITNFDGITESVRVNAVYTKNTYTVTFYADGKLISSVTEKKGKTISDIPTVPQKKGYIGEWNIINFSGIRNDTRVEAVYTKIENHVSFYDAKGSFITDVTVVDGTIPNIPVAQDYADGNVTAKWVTKNADGSFSDALFYDIEDDLKIYIYEYVTVTLIDGENSKEISFDIGAKPSSIKSIIEEKENYDFFGWCFDSGLLNSVSFPYELKENITLYAKWVSVKGTDGLIYLDGNVVGYEGTETNVFIPYRHKNNGRDELITGIADSAFANKDIESVSVAGTVTKIGNRAFDGCGMLKDVLFPDGCYVEEIGEYAFNDCGMLSGFEISGKTLVLGQYAFYNCVSLGSIQGMENSSITVISDYAFANCGSALSDKKLKLNLPSTVAEIGNHAFDGAVNAEIGFADVNALKKIGAYAFNECKKFIGISAINVESVGEGAYAGCIFLIEATVPSGMSLYTSFGLTDPADTAFYSVQIKEFTDETEVTKIYYLPKMLNRVTVSCGSGKVTEKMFYDCYSVKNVILCEGIKEIESYAFLLENNNPTTEAFTVALPDSLEKIKEYAFVGRNDMRSIELNAELKEIGAYAFKDLSSLIGVVGTEKSSVSYVGEYAFDGTTWYKEHVGLIIIGDVVVGISDEYCRAAQFTEVTATMMGKCNVIAPFAFSGNSVLNSITLGEYVNYIGQGAFSESAISEFYFNKCEYSSRRTIESGVKIFEGCEKLETITLYEDVEVESLFTESPETLKTVNIKFVSKKSNIIGGDKYGIFEYMETLTIDFGFTEISEYAFKDNTRLKSVVIGKNIKTINGGAFEGLSGLQTVDMSQNIDLESIGARAFYGTDLSSVQFPQNLSEIGDYAFAGCKALTTFRAPANLKTIGDGAFSGCVSMNTAILSDKLVQIGAYAFRNCNLTEFTVPKELEIYREKQIENTEDTEIVEVLQEGILAGNKNFNTLNLSQGMPVKKLFTVTDGESVTVSIPINFNTVTIDGGEIIDGEFEDITSLQSVTLKNVNAIGAYAFRNCVSVRRITIPSCVGIIKEYAFEGCKSLVVCQIDSENSQLKTVEKGVFKNCTSLTYAVFPTTLDSGDWTEMFNGCTNLLSTNIPVNITEIGDRAFYNCLSIISVGMHNNVTKVGVSAFEGCSDIDFDDVSFTALNVIGKRAFAECDALHGIKAEFAEEIGSEAYYGCDNIEEITVLDEKVSYYTNITSLTKINVTGTPAEDCFEGFSYIEIIIFAKEEAEKCQTAVAGLTNRPLIFVKASVYEQLKDSVPNIHIYPSAVAFEFSYEESGATITGISSNETIADNIVYLPDKTEYNGKVYSVTAIGEKAFEGMSLNTVMVPATVRKIGDGAFINCSDLITVIFESGSELSVIGVNAFRNCTALKSMSFPSSLTEINNAAFYGCNNLESVKFYSNSSLSRIGNNAFENASGLKSVSIKSTLLEIGERAFTGCKSLENFDFGERANITVLGERVFEGASLKELKIPETVTVIGQNALAGYDGSEISFPDGVIRIENGALKNAGNLVSVNFGNRLEAIGGEAFMGCTSLQTVVIPDSVKDIGEGAFSECEALKKLVIGKSVRNIGNKAFYYTQNLANVELNAISLNEVGQNNEIFTKSGKNVGLKVLIGNELVYIPEYMFVPDTVTSNLPSVTELVFDETSSCRRIGAYAFKNVSTLISTVLPISVRAVGEGAFDGTGAKVYSEASRKPGGYKLTTEVTYGYNNRIDGDYSYVIHSGKAYMTGYSGGEKDITVPDMVDEYIVDGVELAFECNSVIEKVTLPETVTEIGSYLNCTSLKEIKFDNNAVEEIFENTFYGCNSLKTITVSDSVQFIGENAFYGCNGLKTVFIDSPFIASSINAESDCGYLIKNALSVYLDEACVEIGDYLINEELASGYKLLPEPEENYSVYTKLYWDAGKSDTDDVKVFLVANINEENSYTLKLYGNGNMKDYNTKTDWNEYNEYIVEVNIGKNINGIGKNAFVNLINLSLIRYESVNAVDFTENKGIFNGSGINGGYVLSIGNEVNNIPAYFLYGSKYLTDIVYDKNATLVSIGDFAFYGCEGISKVVLPDTTQTVGNDAFADCVGLLEITLGTSLTELGDKAFYGTKVLQNIYLNSTEINDFAGDKDVFGSSFSIQEGENGIKITIGSDVTKIPSYMFFKCSNITEVAFPQTKNSALSEIGAFAFGECSEITGITIPATVTRIGNSAFSGAVSLSSIGFDSSFVMLEDIGENAFSETAYYIDESNWTNNVLYLNKYLIKAGAKIGDNYSVSEGTTIIAAGAFSDCADLAYIRIPSSVENIGNGAFSMCYNLKTVYIASKHIVPSIKDSGSVGGLCLNAMHIYITQNLIEMMLIEPGEYIKSTFKCVERNTEINSVVYYTYTTAFWDAGETAGSVSCYLINDIQSPELYELKVSGKGKMIDFGEPNSVPWRSYINSISKISVLEGITGIGSFAFMGCSLATDIEFKGQPSVVSVIGTNAFKDCISITKLSIPESVTEIKTGAFNGCVKLETLMFNANNCADLPVNNGTFENIGADSKGVFVTFDKSVTVIPSNLFNATGSRTGAPNIIEVTFNSQAGVSACASINDFAFAYCEKLTSVVFAEGATLSNIGNGAFEECGSLAMLTIPRGIKQIGKDAFLNCAGITEVFFNATEFESTEEDNYSFVGVGKDNGYDLVISATANYITSNLFKGSVYLKSIEFIEGGVCSEIGESAFEDCVSIKEIVIPSSVMTIGLGAFAGCSGLTKYSTPFIGGKADQLAANKYTNFGYVFGTVQKDDCSETVQTYGIYYIPDSLARVIVTKNTNVYYGTFENCENIQRVELSAAPGTDPMVYEYEIDAAGNKKIVKEIVNGAYIDNMAFRNCSNLFSVKVTEQLKNIGYDAFKNCIRLNSIEIPLYVATIGNNAFYNCAGLTEINFNAESCSDVSEPSYPNLDRENIDKYHEEIEMRSVFYGAGSAQSSLKIKFGPDVLRVPARLFYAPESKVREISFEGDKCTEIGERAFYRAGEQTLIDFELPSSVVKIGTEIIYGTKYYNTGNKWSNGVLYIGNSLIRANESMPQNYTILSNTFVIADGAFANCISLLSLKLSDTTLKRIGNYAFENCVNLNKIDGLNNAVALFEIGNYAFLNCAKLGTNPNDPTNNPKFVIPVNVSSIGNYAFSGCVGIKEVYINSSAVANSFLIESSCGGLCIVASTIYIKFEISAIGRYITDNYNEVGENDGYITYIKAN